MRWRRMILEKQFRHSSSIAKRTDFRSLRRIMEDVGAAGRISTKRKGIVDMEVKKEAVSQSREPGAS